MLLHKRTAVIYGGSGSLGGAVAQHFAKEGAKVFLVARNEGPLREMADKIRSAGGLAEIDTVDANDEKQVNDHLEKIIRTSGRVDISFNAVGLTVVQDLPLIDLPVDDFVDPLVAMLKPRFITGKAAANHMKKQGSGVILNLTATPGGIGYPYTCGFAPGCCALECFTQNLASEIGVYGVRAVTIRSGGSPDSKLFADLIKSYPEVMEGVMNQMKADTMLKRLPPMADIANTAVFLSSDFAASITGVTIDVTCGTTAALNYRARPADQNQQSA